MWKKTLLALTCSAFLVACGDDDSSNDVDKEQPVVPAPTSDLDKAKQLIDTTNNIIAYFDSFKKLESQYQATFDAVGHVGRDVDNATGLVVGLVALAQEAAQGSNKTYDAKALKKLLDEDDAGYYHFIDLENSTLKAVVTADSVTISGSAKVSYWKDYEWDATSKDWKEIFGDDATVTVTDLKFEAPFTASKTTYDFKIVKGGKIATKNANNQEASLSFTQNSTAKATYKTTDKLENRGDTRPESAEFKLSNIVFNATGAELELAELSSKAQKVQLKNGTTVKSELIPSELILKGKAKSGTENLDLDASIKLNNDLSKEINVTTGESANNFINADLNITLKGNVKGGGTTIKPFSIALDAKRNEYLKGSANINIAVDKDALKAEFKTDNIEALKQDQDQTVSIKVSHSNGAYINIVNVDQFKSADIKVGNTTYGTLNRVSNSVYSAKFNDNTVKPIAP